MLAASLRGLISHDEAGHSTVGLVRAAASMAIMPGLSYAQRRAGHRLGSATAVADSEQTLLLPTYRPCCWLSWR